MIRRVTLPAIDERFAYFLGFLLGDGCLGRLSDPYLKLVGDLVDERDYYDRFLVPLILGLFGIGVRPRIKKGQQAYEIAFARKQLIEYLVSKIGFPGWGEAKFIPEVIRKSSDAVKCAFLSGLFDADGTLVFSLKTYGSYCYPTVEIKSVDLSIVNTTKEMLTQLGFMASIRKSAESWVVSVNGIAQLEMWMKLIGSHNIKHLSKYFLWKEHGSCPPYTKLPERLSSLHLNPESFYYALKTKMGIDALSWTVVKCEG